MVRQAHVWRLKAKEELICLLVCLQMSNPLLATHCCDPNQTHPDLGLKAKEEQLHLLVKT